MILLFIRHDFGDSKSYLFNYKECDARLPSYGIGHHILWGTAGELHPRDIQVLMAKEFDRETPVVESNVANLLGEDLAFRGRAFYIVHVHCPPRQIIIATATPESVLRALVELEV